MSGQEEKPAREIVERREIIDGFVPASFRAIEDAVCIVCEVERTELLGYRRSPHMVLARRLVWYIARKELGYTLPRIAALYRADHSTVSHGISKMEKNEKANALAAAVLEICGAQLRRF